MQDDPFCVWKFFFLFYPVFFWMTIHVVYKKEEENMDIMDKFDNGEPWFYRNKEKNL